jgi:formylglycine-generating enzyme required for sulfatase activity
MLRKLMMLIAICLLLFACTKTTKPMETVLKPSISPEAGEFLQEQTIEITCPTPEALIYYTLDGAEPTESSTQYAAPFSLSTSVTVKARAFKEKMKPSDIDSVAYTFSVSPIMVSPLGGTYSAPVTVTMSFITPGTVIHYTTDGSEPDVNSTAYTYPFVLDGNATIKAKGFINGWLPSETRTVVYNFVPSLPSLSVIDGTYYSPFTVAMSSTTTGAVVRYTTDGTTPDVNSTLYAGPVTISQSTIITARAFKVNWTPSGSVTGNFILKAVAPVFAPGQGNYTLTQNVTITTTTPGAGIHYTTDGSTPDEASALYTGPVALDATGTLKAVAVKSGWNNSNVTSGVYNFSITAPTFNPQGGSFADYPSVTISCVTPSVQIRYTIDGNEPTATSTLYTNPVEITSTTTLKAKAYRTGWSTSTTTSATYTITQTQTVATPVINPTGGTFTAPQSVVITCITNGASIRYTTDDSVPTLSSPEYSTPISISQNTTINAKAFLTGWYDSQMASESYVINFTLGEMINVPAGTFTMGRTNGSGDADEQPIHDVTVAAFSIGKYEVTQQEYLTVMGNNPSFITGDLYRPVESVNWYAAVVYCNKRSILEGLTPAYSLNGVTNPTSWGAIPTVFDTTWNTMACNWTANGYRLPTEAEWEYAARGAVNTPDYTYSGSNNVDEVAWYRTNSGGFTQIVGHLLSNGLETNDMSGNVSEWCWDWYSSTYYNASPSDNPTGPTEGSYRITRGGNCDDHTATLVRVAERLGLVPYYVSFTHGLRIVRANL